MDKERESGAYKAANAAGAIHGAIKTGKAIAGAARGAALGPYGIAASLVWQNRKTIGKVVAAIAVLLFLPILFVLMLPSLIFGVEQGSGSLNDSAAIAENLNKITFAVNGILAEGIEDAKRRIEADFISSGADYYELINPYEGNTIGNVNLFIAQYCAYKNADYESISLADMESLLRASVSELYAFTAQEEIRTVETENPVTGELETIDETRRIYTLVYNGDSYFADTAFKLSEEQAKLAKSYAENLSVFLGGGSVQYLPNVSGGVSLEGVVFSNGATNVVYYNQTDPRFADKPYGTDNIGEYGCGPTVMAIVVSSLSAEMVDPFQMAEWAYGNGYWCKGSGSYHGLIPAAAEHWGLTVESVSPSEPQTIVDALASGKLVVALMTKGHFTNSGHFMVISGVTADGKILVADPGSYTRSNQEWELSLILRELSRSDSSGAPLWAVD
ncbi:MAG: C39 family peptidase [Oscillospiraceae bacterium]|jgi:hypothetical protein|nr:C39 family peptidase [Oscillospiraceae bacterium]